MADQLRPVETREESYALQAEYEAAIDAGAIDSLDDGGIVRRAFLAGWLGGRDWARRQLLEEA